MRTPVIIPFGEFDNTAVGSYSGLLDMYLKPPFACMLSGIEVVANFTTGGSNVATLTATGIDGFGDDITLTGDGTMATDVIEVKSRDMRIDAAQEVKFSVSFDNATYSVERLHVILWLEADRLQGGTDRPLRGSTNEMADHPQKAGTSVAADVAEMNTELDENFNSVTGAEKVAANRRLTRITVHVRWDSYTSLQADDMITGGEDREVYSWDHYATGDAADASIATLKDEVPANVFTDTLTYAATTAKNQGNVVNDAQALDPAAAADLYRLVFDDPGANYRQVVVLYWL